MNVTPMTIEQWIECDPCARELPNTFPVRVTIQADLFTRMPESIKPYVRDYLDEAIHGLRTSGTMAVEMQRCADLMRLRDWVDYHTVDTQDWRGTPLLPTSVDTLRFIQKHVSALVREGGDLPVTIPQDPQYSVPVLKEALAFIGEGRDVTNLRDLPIPISDFMKAEMADLIEQRTEDVESLRLFSIGLTEKSSLWGDAQMDMQSVEERMLDELPTKLGAMLSTVVQEKSSKPPLSR